MNISPPDFLPVARRDELISREVEGELLIYDRLRDTAHCLNASAAAIWNRCDGHSTVAQIAHSIAEQTGVSADENFVQLGLDELSERHLLQGVAPSRAKGRSTMSRREAVRRIGLGAAIALPIVITITAPTPAQAGSCRAAGASCGTGSQCCSGTCSGGSCLGGFANPQGTRRRT